MREDDGISLACLVVRSSGSAWRSGNCCRAPAQLHTAFACSRVEDGLHGRRVKTVDQAGQVGVVYLAHHLRRPGRQRMEGAVTQPHAGGRFPCRLEAGWVGA